MLTFFLLFLLFLVLFVLSIKAGLTLMGRLAGRQVRRQHEAAEYIINTGKVPEEWDAKTNGARGWWRIIGGKAVPPQVLAVGRLSMLIDHFEKSSLVDSEPARKLLVSELQSVLQQWKERQ